MESLKIEKSIIVNANIKRVWRALTNPDELSTWFGKPIEFEQLNVGEQVLIFKEHHGEIAIVDPPHNFAFYWPAEVGYNERNLVTFNLESFGDKTRVTVREEGFEGPPEVLVKKRFEMNSRGWVIQMENLKNYLEGKTNG
jgi:uncharacterized protein YndB with AHSA1/START domain